MKVFRDVFAAVMVGILGGFLVTIVSYYNHHKEGGIFHTMMAIVNSYDTVATAYGGDDGTALSFKDYDIENQVLEAFESVENGESSEVYGALIKSILENASDGSEGDILAMEGEDGNLSEGMPYSSILRFHVRANSDSEEDQALKMAVKEDVVTMLKPLLKNCESIEESKNVIVSNMQTIYTTAVNTIVEQGYDYTVKVYVTEEEFPEKTYGDLTFPEGSYQALRIDIGKAKGQNWWCVMYPPLCFVDESTTIVSEDGKELLKKNLTDEEYRQLFINKNTEKKAGLKVLDWLKENR